MKKIEDLFIIENYYNELNMQKIFIDDMKSDMRLLKFEKHEYLIREDEDLEYLLFFIQGKAKVFKTLPNGRSLLLAFYKPFRVIGDIEIIKNQSATGTVLALSTCYCLAIPMEKARLKLIKDNKFLKFTCESLAEKLAAVSMNSSINLLYPLENRLASYINESLTYGDDLYIDFDENLNNIAELLGSSYRHLLRTFNTLCKKGVLKREDGKYKIINKALLKDLAGDLYQDAKFL
ncbi:cyclic nucleotide-binding domain-containing protein [Terrisporobacter mayombei]|uniref:Regulatory protein YeiL n=1 Tax=Terrisporobacter mayombei TaxID=1541 RepID=A0ABY9Q3A3_9FIRM|nr:cyclic nucleotide-binding domain-containing protein [Terrisporobacter mayombei]MCC3870043.1 cyclic nucleotide-binding domain-containing protein [Terrisporobacter mayombei]WMT82463.1 Regulatory protein YeiL [Terrisporobacter mayombei]